MLKFMTLSFHFCTFKRGDDDADNHGDDEEDDSDDVTQGVRRVNVCKRTVLPD